MRNLAVACFTAGCVCLVTLGCRPSPGTDPIPSMTAQALRLGIPQDTKVELKHWRQVEAFDRDLAQFESVFWDLEDTHSLREKIHQGACRGRSVLEIGTGTGLLSLCCLQAGARHVVATDINPVAIANARYNAELLGLQDRFDVRYVSKDNSTAYAVCRSNERFDLILSNPPWEDGSPVEFADYAFYDPGFSLLDSILVDLRSRLNPGGKLWLAFGCREAIETTYKLAKKYKLDCRTLDERDVRELDEIFLPGMLLEISLPVTGDR